MYLLLEMNCCYVDLHAEVTKYRVLIHVILPSPKGDIRFCAV